MLKLVDKLIFPPISPTKAVQTFPEVKIYFSVIDLISLIHQL